VNCGSVSGLPVPSFEVPFNSKALRGRLPVALEKDAGADEGNVGEGRLEGHLKSGRGSGPGEFSRGDGPSERPGVACGRWSTMGEVDMEAILPNAAGRRV